MSTTSLSYCNVYIQFNVFSSLFVRPLADVPNILKSSCDEPVMRLGEPLVSDIIMSVTDKHGNKTGKVSWIYETSSCNQEKESFFIGHGTYIVPCLALNLM